ncbi:MAG TPA: cytochrome c biogenesis protein CcsA [Candidatus Limnocylindria bacterium]|jgi:cytochrome c-type biogenesis protein CcsB
MAELLSLLLVASLVVLLGTGGIGLAALAMAGRVAGGVLATETGPPITPTTESTGARLRALSPVGVAVALALLLAAVVLRTILVGHAPWSNLHEFTIAFAAALLATYLLLLRTAPIAALAPLAALLAAALVGIALGLDDRVDPLVPALQQPLLLTIHVGTAALSYAVAGVAFLAAAAELAQRATGDRLAALPSREVLRSVGHRAVLIAFPILTVAIALGSVWANLAWRAYWSNDPKELAAAATWLVFGAYLHVAGRRDRWEALAPWLIVLGFVGVLFTYLGAGLFIVGEHSYGAP